MPPKIKVTSSSFSRHPVLRAELEDAFPETGFNDTGAKYDRAGLIDHIGDADGLILALDDVDDGVLAACPNLKIVSKYGVGLDNLDVTACERRGITVGWTGGTNKRSVAEMDLAFMIALMRNLYPSSMALKGGRWAKDGGRQLSGSTVGIIGLGYTGSEIIRLLAPFNCRILGNDILDKSDLAAETGIELVDKETIFREADVITLHVPLTDQTRHMINDETLGRMRTDAFVINTARGPVVDEAALKHALLTGQIAGAAIDAYTVEPPNDQEFLDLPNLFCTPHIGGNADEAVLAMGRSAIRHVKEFFDA